MTLQRFVRVQDGVFETAMAELATGHKRSHWMWFIFPQLRGLGRSATAEHFGIVDLTEARDYLLHPVLGFRLECATAAVLEHEGRTLRAIFGTPDDLKFHSSMTLFVLASGERGIFAEALRVFCGGREDALTVRLLGAADAH